MYSGMSTPERWTLPNALREMAVSRPDTFWVRTSGGNQLSFVQAESDAARIAGFLSSNGVRPGDLVPFLMPNEIDFVRLWMGLARLGAIAVPLNTELKGSFLSHQLKASGARTAVVHPHYLETLEEVLSDVPELKSIITAGACSKFFAGSTVEQIDWQGWTEAPRYDGPYPQPQQIATVMFTSGTSGPSKGVLMTHAHCTLFGIGIIDALQVQPDDAYYITLPLFHANGLFMQLGTSLLAGISAFIRPKFSASAWLADVVEQQITITHMLGTTAAYVLAQPPHCNEQSHKLRVMFNAPNIPAHESAFRRRFGVRDVISGYGMTEVCNPVLGQIGVSAPGAAGWVDSKRFEVQVVHPQTDVPVPHGELGEIVVRPKIAFTMMAGYHGQPEKTAEAWRNLWFHTGDAGTLSRTGLVVFVDRIKDCIRRRGENISSTEVEAIVGTIPGVLEAAAYAVPSDMAGAEDEIALAIVREPAGVISAEEIGSIADALLPRFARPRFIRLMEQLPKTATGKIQRAELRQQGAKAAHDREAGGTIR